MTKTTQYKNTPIGPIPTDWEVKKLGDICKKTGSNLTNADINEKDGIYNVYGASGLIKQVDFFQESTPYISIVKDGAGVGRVLICEANSSVLATMDKIHNNESVNLFYLSLLLNNIDFEKYITGSTIPHIYFRDYKIKNIPLPPLPEQQKIADVLSTWDKAIQETDTIIKKLQARNKALAFSLLTGKKRVKGFEDKEFKKSLANEVFKSVSIKNNPEDSVLLSATQEFGMIPRDMIETRVTMPSGSLKTYKLVEKGDFVISLRSFQGGIEYSEYTGLVSPAYTVLKSINPINDDFYKYYFKSEDLIGRLSVAVIGIRDGKNISYDDFSTIVLPNPSLEEQNAIAEILNTANQEVKQYQQQLEALKLQKKGLMQQLLTGKVRTV